MGGEVIEVHLAKKIGEHLEAVRAAMAGLAAAYAPEELQGSVYGLYERFRRHIARGRRGRGQKGALDLALIRSLTERD
jgi:hypothetical protein